MKFYELELEGQTIELRMTTSNAKQLESKTGKSIFDLVQEINEKIKDLEYESEDYYI